MSKPPAVSSLTDHLGYWLRYVSNHVSHAFALKLAARDVTVAEWVVLRDLYDNERAIPSELAARIGMTRGAVSKLADRLARKSLLTRLPSATDRRYQALVLTPAGRKLVPALAALADANDMEFFGHMAATEKRRLKAALEDVVRRHAMRTIPID